MHRASMPTRGRAPIRGALAAVLAATIAVVLSGCFMIPLVDGRSPFDDPFGSSESDIEKAIPPIQAALDESGAGGDRWHLVAESASENCEGPCNLYVAVRVEPADVDDPDRWVSEEVLRETLIAVVPVAESQRVDVAVVSGYRKNEYGGLVSGPLSSRSSANECVATSSLPPRTRATAMRRCTRSRGRTRTSSRAWAWADRLRRRRSRPLGGGGNNAESAVARLGRVAQPGGPAGTHAGVLGGEAFVGDVQAHEVHVRLPRDRVERR